jgi:hypothetical protein
VCLGPTSSTVTAVHIVVTTPTLNVTCKDAGDDIGLEEIELVRGVEGSVFGGDTFELLGLENADVAVTDLLSGSVVLVVAVPVSKLCRGSCDDAETVMEPWESSPSP